MGIARWQRKRKMTSLKNSPSRKLMLAKIREQQKKSQFNRICAESLEATRYNGFLRSFIKKHELSMKRNQAKADKLKRKLKAQRKSL